MSASYSNNGHESLGTLAAERHVRMEVRTEKKCKVWPPPNGRGLSQISDYELCGFVDQRFERFVRETFGVVYDRCMCQRLHRCEADECRKIQIDGTKLITVGFQVGPE